MGKALMDNNKLLLIQGPPGERITLHYYYVVILQYISILTGTGKSKTCVELIKRFVGPNYNKAPPAEGPTVLYCAPSNKAVNVGACKASYIYITICCFVNVFVYNS